MMVKLALLNDVLISLDYLKEYNTVQGNIRQYEIIITPHIVNQPINVSFVLLYI